MPAPFVVDLAGYRGANGNPNTSDNHDAGSVRLGRALFDVLGIPRGQSGPEDAGEALEEAVKSHLASLRPDLEIDRGRHAFTFDQYGHLAVFPAFRKGHRSGEDMLARLRAEIEKLGDPRVQTKLVTKLDSASFDLRTQDQLVLEMLTQMPEESLLKVDVTVGEGRQSGLPLLAVALSSKWSLRTDRIVRRIVYRRVPSWFHFAADGCHILLS